MKPQSQLLAPEVVRLADGRETRHGWRIPGTSKLGTLLQIGILAIFLLPAVTASADEEMPPTPGPGMEHGRHFDWVIHTQQTLDELKVKLNLAPAQLVGWSTWSKGVMDDSKQQLGQKNNGRDQKQAASKATSGETTPEKMSRGIEHLKSETAWMQEHLAQLEAAQIRTSAFYATLDTNQKTIFDLFWHELYHRISGHDQSGTAPIGQTPSPLS